jgi:hypothetical protein
MKATSSGLPALSSLRVQVLPVKSGRLKSGALVPSGSIVD